MKVYLGIYQYNSGCGNSWDTVERVFDDEVKALEWINEFQDTDYACRIYQGIEVE